MSCNTYGARSFNLLQDFAHRNDMLLFETSAKDGTDVELAVIDHGGREHEKHENEKELSCGINLTSYISYNPFHLYAVPHNKYV